MSQTKTLADIALAVETQGRCVTETGEVWKRIMYPGFRDSPKAQAWKYASSHGKLMSADLQRVLQANPNSPAKYCRTSLPITAEGSAVGMGTTPVLLHRVIAYTFLGNPANANDTVDHIDRDRSNNRVDNLRWASPAEQLDNRVRRTVFLENVASNTMHSLDEIPHARQCVRAKRHGDTLNVGDQTMRVHVEERKLVSLQHAPDRLGRPKLTKPPKKHQALHSFIEGKSVDDITQTMHIARSTALSYLGQAAREASHEVLRRLGDRLQLQSEEALQALAQDLDLLNWQVAQDIVTQTQYLPKYRQIVAKHVPCLGGDWEVVKQVWRCLVNIKK